MTWMMKVNEEREDAAIEATIKAGIKHNDSPEMIVSDLISEFQLSESEARERLDEYLLQLV